MQLSEHFSLDEMVASQTGARLGIDNTPAPDILENLKKTCEGLELVRSVLGHGLTVSSGYRCQTLNKAVGGAADSAHVQGWAADIVCPGFGDPYHVAAKILASGIEFDQLIQEGADPAKGYSGWVHVSFAPAMRRQVLHADFSTGKPVYTAGLRGTAVA